MSYNNVQGFQRAWATCDVISCYSMKLCELTHLYQHQDGRVVKALDLRSNGRIVRVGSNPTPGFIFFSIFVTIFKQQRLNTFSLCKFKRFLEVLLKVTFYSSLHEVASNI